MTPEHDAESRVAIDRPRVDSAPERLKVLDLGTMIAGPVVATYLGDLGAEIIKVEQPGTGDTVREGRTRAEQGLHGRWLVEGRNKRSVTLNLRVPRGQEILRDLAKWADILVENFRPGTMGGWGLGYEDLAQVNPRLVYVSVSGYGQDGPYRGRAGYDFTGGAFGGMTAVTGYADRPPVLPGLAIVDYATGAFATIGALEAVRQRDCPGGTGKGRWLDCALYESVLRMSGHDIVNYGRSGKVRDRECGMPIKAGPSQSLHTFTYRTRDDRWVSLYVVVDRQYEKLADLIGEPAREHPELKTKEGRLAHADEFYALVSDWVETVDLEELTALMEEAGLAFSPVNTLADIVTDPHVEHRKNIVSIEAEGEEILMQNAFPRFHRGAENIRWAGESLGASNADVYRGLLGMSEAELAKLEAEQVI